MVGDVERPGWVRSRIKERGNREGYGNDENMVGAPLAACVSQDEIKREVEVDTRPLIEPEFVMSEIELLGSNDGSDLDNDGTPDNGLALLFEDPYIVSALGGDPNEYIAKSIRRAELLLLLDFVTFQGYSNDAAVDIDIFLGHDPDGDKDNNLMVKSLR